jgi:thioredoxin 1
MFKQMTFTNVQRKLIEPMELLTMPENVITEMSKDSFSQLLQTNNGILIIKFGAEWCGPCKKIDPLVYDWMNKLSAQPNVQCAIIDIDDNFEIYAFLKSKKMVNGVPVILCYKKGNHSWIPDKAVVGADERQVNIFFQECSQFASSSYS